MALSKINSKSLEDSTVLSADIADDSIINADIKSDAAIAQSKLVDIVDADIGAGAAIVTSKLSGAVTSIASHGLAASATTDTTNADNIGSGTVDTARLGTGTADSTKFLRGDNTWQVVSSPVLDSPVITGTLSVLSSGSVSHTITNWSDDVSYTIVPTNCTVGAVNGSGVFVVTHTSGSPSYTIKATTDSLGLDDSAVVTKNITIQLSAPTLSSPADSYETVNVTYTITSTTGDDDKLILNIGSSNFTYQSVSVGTASKVGNTVECVGFTTNNPAVVIQYTAEATYSVTATSVKIDGSFGTSASSSADSITILNPTLSAPAINSPANAATSTNVAYTITSNDANDNKLILDIGSSNFNFGSVSVGSASKVGNTVECTGFTTNNPVVTIQFTVEATYSVTAKATDTTGYYHDSVNSSADSLTIVNFVGMAATGGSITTVGDYKIHTFTSSGTFNITTLGEIGTVQFLLLAGGGAGGNSNVSGGGGAGGYATAATGEATTTFSVSATSYTITVGAGGAASVAPNNSSGYYTTGASGSNSIFSSVTCTGGGGGGARFTNGGNGGSGGGEGYTGNSAPGTANSGSFGSEVMGYNGGSSTNGTYHSQGGGGGAGAVGVTGIANVPVAGGSGRYSSITGSSIARGGGGGGSLANRYVAPYAGGAGGVGGGGAGLSQNGTAGSGAGNTGSGGGGVSHDYGATSGAGGSGVCIIKFKFQ